MRAICAVNFMETAKPALSEAGEVIFDPDDRRWSDWLKLAEDCMSSEAAFCADRFVLMTITNSFRESPREGHLICATSMSRVRHFMGDAPFFPAGFSGCRPPVLRQHCHRKNPQRLKFQMNFFFEKRDQTNEFSLVTGLISFCTENRAAFSLVNLPISHQPILGVPEKPPSIVRVTKCDNWW
jgi:hypothetical protein